MGVRLLALILVFSFLIPHAAMGQSAVVSSSELQQAIVAATQTRQKNLDDVKDFLSREPVKAALKTGKVDYRRVQKAVSTLEPAELARLAARTNQIQRDFAAGALTNQQLTYIVIALGAAVLVLVLH